MDEHDPENAPQSGKSFLNESTHLLCVQAKLEICKIGIGLQNCGFLILFNVCTYVSCSAVE
jgi:hypothetical protein